MNLRMCLNWKVLGALGAVGIAVVVIAPGLASAALPVLLLAACPLSMLAMALGMRGMGGADRKQATTAGAYTCPMHPHVSSATPGQCPTCGMALVPAPAAVQDPLSALQARLVALQADEVALSREIAAREQADAPTGVRATASEANR